MFIYGNYASNSSKDSRFVQYYVEEQTNDNAINDYLKEYQIAKKYLQQHTPIHIFILLVLVLMIFTLLVNAIIYLQMNDKWQKIAIKSTIYLGTILILLFITLFFIFKYNELYAFIELEKYKNSLKGFAQIKNGMYYIDNTVIGIFISLLFCVCLIILFVKHKEIACICIILEEEIKKSQNDLYGN